jgi:hypothetical protein
MADFSVRSLQSLEASASTARVLNLLGVWRKYRDEPAHRAQPFFSNEMLNRAILVKHRLRRDEIDLMPVERTICTKVLMPIDVADLRLGGVSIFVGERYWAEKLASALCAGDVSHRDLKLLEELDAIPSLDPFITREQLKRKGYAPAALYFEINPVDLARMSAFVQEEIEPLVTMSLAGSSARSASQAEKLVSKILSSRVDDEMEPLRLTLRLRPEEYSEGVFCWKGFLYYKWLMSSVMGKVGRVNGALRSVKPTGQADAAAFAAIDGSRRKIAVSLRESCVTVLAALQVYDDAYAKLIGNESPLAFREFLLSAPRMFVELGEKLGALQHIVSFWTYRFPLDQTPKAPVEELLEILREFESSLSHMPPPDATPAMNPVSAALAGL